MTCTCTGIQNCKYTCAHSHAVCLISTDTVALITSQFIDTNTFIRTDTRNYHTFIDICMKRMERVIEV